MHYIIDGYNLLFWLKGDRDQLESLRRSFIQDMDKKAALLKMDITIIFDGHFRQDEETRSHFRHIEIIYTSHGESADEVIISELKSSLDVRREIVITSDRDLAWRVKKLHAKTERAPEFYRKIQERARKRQKQELKKTPPKKRPALPPTAVETESFVKDESLTHYQKIFEARLKEEEREAQKQPTRKKSPGQQKVDEFNRWLEIFEKRIESQDL